MGLYFKACRALLLARMTEWLQQKLSIKESHKNLTTKSIQRQSTLSFSFSRLQCPAACHDISRSYQCLLKLKSSTLGDALQRSKFTWMHHLVEKQLELQTMK